MAILALGDMERNIVYHVRAEYYVEAPETQIPPLFPKDEDE
jgi:hypothetical protein